MAALAGMDLREAYPALRPRGGFRYHAAIVALPLPALAQSTRPPSYADIEALPPNVVGEILGGELVVSPRPRPRHARAASNLGMLVGPPFRLGRGGPGGWQILDEPELSLDVSASRAAASLGIDRRYDPVVPDLAGWRLETMPHLPSPWANAHQ